MSIGSAYNSGARVWHKARYVCKQRALMQWDLEQTLVHVVCAVYICWQIV